MRFLVAIYFFTFKNFNLSSHCPVASIVPDEKSAVTVTEVPFYLMSHFLLLISRFSFYSWCSAF